MILIIEELLLDWANIFKLKEIVFRVKRVAYTLLVSLTCLLMARAQVVRGLNVVGPFDEKLNMVSIQAIRNMDAQWVTFLPEVILNRSSLKFEERKPGDQWTHSEIGYRNFIAQCKEANLKVILKPHLNLSDVFSEHDRIAVSSTWRGDIMPVQSDDWSEIESVYQDFILGWAEIAAIEEVDAFFIGTELRSFVNHRPQFWDELIVKVRSIYSGPISYSANWDNYKNIPFWQDLDFIGVNGYFPVSKDAIPNVSRTKTKWKKIKKELKKIYKTTNKHILITEFGYRNISYAGLKPWLHVSQTQSVIRSDISQYNLLQAFFESIWNEDYIIGGLLWNWPQKVDHNDNTDFSIQNKSAERLVKEWFSTNL